MICLWVMAENQAKTQPVEELLQRITTEAQRKSTLWVKTVRRRDTPDEPTGMYLRRAREESVSSGGRISLLALLAN